MNFVDKFNFIDPPKPTVFHRIFIEPEDWRVQTADIFKKIETKYNKLIAKTANSIIKFQ